MVTIYKVRQSVIDGKGKFLIDYVGLSDDEKPSSVNGGTIENGSSFIELDTQKLYLYDQEHDEWLTPEEGGE